jgi:hypothetical protein
LDDIQRTSGAWVNLVPQTRVDGDRGPAIRITLKVLQQTTTLKVLPQVAPADTWWSQQAFASAPPPLEKDPVFEMEVMCSKLMEP